MTSVLILILAVCERVVPFRTRALSFFSPASERLAGIGFFIFGTLFSQFAVVTFFVELGPMARARFPDQSVGWLAFGAQFLAVFACEELACYINHRLFHSIPLLWRLHAVHHAPKELDGFVALRVHPLEQAINFTRRWAIMFLATCVVGFSLRPTSLAIVLGGFYNVIMHLNISFRKILGEKWAGYYERVFFSPDSHSVHHVAPHFGKNCGRMFVIFDKLGGTYSAYRVTNDDYGFPKPESFPASIPAQLAYFLTEPFRNLTWPKRLRPPA